MFCFVRSPVWLSSFPILSLLVLSVASAPLMAQGTATSGSGGWDELVGDWGGTPAGSPAERTALDRMRQFVTVRFGDDAVEAYLRYWASTDPESAQADLQVAVSGAERADIRWGRAEEMLETFADYQQLTIGAADLEQIQANPVSTDVDLTTSQVDGFELELDPPEAILSGDPFELSGIVRNHTDEHIFLAPEGLVVEVPARLIGMKGGPQFIAARFPPNLRRVPRDDTVWTALAPGTETSVSWYREAESAEGMKRLTSWLYRRPGEYPIRAHVSGWLGHLPSDGSRSSQAEFLRRETPDYNVHVRASMTHLLPLAWIGGLVVLLLQAVITTPRTGGAMARHGFLSFGKGLVASLTLVTVIIIMNEFTQGTPLLPTLDVTTFGAAVAAGMLIQWLGHKYYLPLISGEANAPAPMPTSGGGVAQPATPDVMTEVVVPRSMAVGGSEATLAPTGRADPDEGGSPND
jgi:hypothetical protein